MFRYMYSHYALIIAVFRTTAKRATFFQISRRKYSLIFSKLTVFQALKESSILNQRAYHSRGYEKSLIIITEEITQFPHSGYKIIVFDFNMNIQ